MYTKLRHLLYQLDPEKAHAVTLGLIKWAGTFPITAAWLRSIFEVNDPRLEVEAFGLKFKNPVGLAAGYDKNGVAVKGLSCLGFGHLEVGTVTLKPQMGNPRPRLHRIHEVNALINSLGFPNLGVDALKLKRGMAGATKVGINIGKGKDTPPERAAEDYSELLRRVHMQADYVALNVSSPNTPGLRKLQGREFLENLLRSVTEVRDSLTPRVPLLVKIAPDLIEREIDDVLLAVMDCGIDGVIATNTTLNREAVPHHTDTPGGLSGAPLRARATEVIRYIARRTEGKLPIIGVGGIASAEDALEKLRAGARLVQFYTGLVYAGPGLAREINRGLLHTCEVEGLKDVNELNLWHRVMPAEVADIQG
jgi:dihydroorotate dehydrogenase